MRIKYAKFNHANKTFTEYSFEIFEIHMAVFVCRCLLKSPKNSKTNIYQALAKVEFLISM